MKKYKTFKKELLQDGDTMREYIFQALEEIIEQGHDKTNDTYDYDLIGGQVIRLIGEQRYFMEKNK